MEGLRDLPKVTRLVGNSQESVCYSAGYFFFLSYHTTSLVTLTLHTETICVGHTQIASKSHKNPMKKVLFRAPLDRGGNKGTER